MYWNLGKRITEENHNFERYKIYGDEVIKRIANAVGKSRQTIQYSIQFVSKYKSLDELPEGKNITWHKIVNNYLPKEKKEVVLPEGKFGVIYADPPWPYPERLDAKNLYGARNYHYDELSIKDLCELKVKELSADNAVLFIWVATNFLKQSFEIIESWGFKYKSNIVWIKSGRGGIGYYVKGDHELLLIATKGSCLPKTDKLISSVLKAPKQEHSKKPKEVYEMIETLYPDNKYIELFARNKRNGWVSWGNEINV